MYHYKISCPNKSRQIKKAIQTILQKKLVKVVKRYNYIKSYSINDYWKVNKKEEKILLLIDCNNIKNTKKIIEWILWEKIYILQKIDEK